MRPSLRRIKLILSLIIFLNFTLGIGSPPYFPHFLNLSLRRLKAVSVERMALSELRNPGPLFLATVKGPEAFSLETKLIPTPAITADEILIIPRYVGLCATDIDIWTHLRPAVPGVIGHEVAAEVIRVGENVKDIKAGDLITINPNDPLSTENIIGFNGTGFLGSVFKVPKEFVKTVEKTIFSISPGTSLLDAVFTEPLSTVHFAQDVMKDDIKGKTVVVVGGGSTGDLHVNLARRFGAREVILLEKDAEKLSRSVENGFVDTNHAILADEKTVENVLKATEGRGADVVIIATSEFRTVQWALPYLAQNAVINLYGKIKKGDVVNFQDGGVFDAYAFYKSFTRGNPVEQTISADGKTIKFILTRGAREEDFAKSVELLESGGVRPFGIISHVVSLEALPEVFKGIYENYRLHGEVTHKVLVDTRLKGKVILNISDYLRLFGFGKE